MSRHPTAKWAQRSDKVYLTIELPDAKDVKMKLEPEGKFVLSATKDGVPYVIDIELIDKVNVEESKVSVGLRSIVYVIKKSERKWWTRLLKQEGRPPAFLKADWDKWVDEEEDKKGMDFDDMDFSKLDMGGDDDLDMDDFKDGDEEDVGTKGEESKSEAEPASEAVGEDKKLDMGGDDDLDMDDFKDGDEEDVGTKGEESKSEAEPASEAVGEDKKLDMGGDDDLDMDDFKDGDEEDAGTKGEESKSEAEPASEAVGEDKV